MAALVCDGVRGDLRGLTRCASPWACPVCAPKLAVSRARVLAPQVADLLNKDWTAWLCTLTVRHDRRDELVDLLAGLRDAWSRLTSGKNGQVLRALGSPEYVRGMDLTWSSRNGWHPHIHVMLLLPPGHGDGRATANAFAVRWRRVLGGLGFEALSSAQDVAPCRDAAAAAAYATAPAAVYEATGIGTKTARDPRSGLTAFDLLRGAVPAEGEPDPAMVARWCEYVAAVKGRKQTSTSRGLTLEEDEALIEEPEAPSDFVAMVGGEAVAELDRTRRTADLLEAVEGCDTPRGRRMAAWAVLSGLRSVDWYLCALPSPAVQPDLGDGHQTAPPYRPPEGWVSPLTDDGRVWRRVTLQDRAVLARLAIEG